jgi:hypothetical protein
MRELHIGNGSIVVSFAICDALFNYGLALSKAGTSDRVTVPILEAGKPGFSNILLGPSTQLFCTSGGTDEFDLHDGDVVAELERRTAALQPQPVRPVDNADIVEPYDWE